ncbi:MAG: ABC transporter substrate-binding protein [Actinomycetota bacterium]|nr:ABC transporter substrate-binding protein [Actinomycetota bacterium]
MRTPLPAHLLTENSLSLVMRRRTFLKGMAGVAGAAVLGACSSAQEGGGGVGGTTLRVRAWTDFGYPTPFTYTAGPGYWKQSLLFDTLTWPDSTGQQLPWLAESYQQSEDGLSYTVQLRDVQWSDGRPLTARDVAFTYEYYTEPGDFYTGKRQIFTPLLIGVPRRGADVVPQGDRTVEFRLPRPDATFLQYVLGTMPIVPEHVWSTNDNPMAARDPRFLVGTGAYSLESREVAQDVEVYAANDRYFLGRPFVRRIDMVGAEDPLTALRAGELDGAATEVEGAPNELLAPFQNNPEFAILSKQGAWGFPLFFNLSRGGALGDVRFRRACLHALNRPEMVRRLLTGNGKEGSAGFVSPDSAYYNGDIRQYPFDPAEAGRLLDEAGYRRAGNSMRRNPDGTALRYTLRIPELVSAALAELVAANLNEAGIDVELQRVELVRLFGLKTAGDYDLLMTSFPGPAGTGPGGDPEFLRGVYHTPPPDGRPPMQNATGYSNPQVDRLLDEQLATVDFEARKRLVGEIQRIVADDLPVAMLYYPTLFFIYRPRVFDQWYYTPGGFGPGIDTDVYNKQAYITGRKVGTEVRS